MIDPWEKAWECEHAIRTCGDLERKSLLTSLRELWVAIANERAGGMPNWLTEAEKAHRLHADVLRRMLH
jgi:hypothetical protein